MNRTEMSKKIVDSLGLTAEPVAITFIKPGQPLPSGYTEPEKPIRHCQAIMRAKHGEMLVVPPKKQACPISSSAFGMMQIPDKVRSGEYHYLVGMYESPEFAAKTIAARTSLEPGSVIAVAVAPLSKATIEPDVVVVTGTPEQLFWLIPAAATFSVGGRVTVDMAAIQSTCVDSTIIPYVTGNVNLSLGCLGCRRTTDIRPEEMLIGIPGKRLPEMVRALEMLGAGPLRMSRQKAF